MATAEGDVDGGADTGAMRRRGRLGIHDLRQHPLGVSGVAQGAENEI